MVKTKLGPNSHCNRAHILCRHFLPKNDWSKQSKNSCSCCKIDWACFARALAMAIALALYRDLIRGQFHPEYCHLLHAGRERLKRQRRLLFWKTLTTVATIFTFWPPASDGTVHLCLSFTPVEDIKKTTSYLNVIVSFSSRLVWVTLALFSPPGHPKNLEPPTEMQNTWCSFHDKKLKVKEKKTAPPLAKLPTNLSSESLACNQQMVDMIASID